MQKHIRRLTIEDYDNILKVWSDAGLPFRPQGRDTKDRIAQEMAAPNCAFFGMFDGDDMMGVGIANWDGRRGWVNRVAIDPEHRGRGLAGEIIRECEKFLEERGALIICALIEDMNTPSMDCFEKEGYSCMKEILYFSKRQSPEV